MVSTTFIGIDVARDRLDLAVRPTGEPWQVANDPAGHAALVARLRARRPRVIVLEATGGLERPLLAALGGAGLPVVAVNPAPGARTSPGRAARWRRRMPWTPRSWPTSPRPSSPPCGPCPRPPLNSSLPWLPAAASSS